jgi:hypothetical protein
MRNERQRKVTKQEVGIRKDRGKLKRKKKYGKV